MRRQSGDGRGADPGPLGRMAAGEGTSGNVRDVYHRLRSAILSGSMPAGQTVNQVHLAREMGVSRTPVREALRMLQAEGLVEAEYQQRMRVTNVTPDEIDAIYATWILVEALSVALTVPRLTDDDVESIKGALRRMNASASKGRRNDWDTLHRTFHRLLLSYAGPVLMDSIAACWDRSERVRRTYGRTEPVWQMSADEHAAIVEAYIDGSVERAILAVSRHLARTALTVIAHIDPNYDPRAIRQAVSLATHPDRNLAQASLGVIGPSTAPRSNGAARVRRI